VCTLCVIEYVTNNMKFTSEWYMIQHFKALQFLYVPSAVT